MLKKLIPIWLFSKIERKSCSLDFKASLFVFNASTSSSVVCSARTLWHRETADSLTASGAVLHQARQPHLSPLSRGSMWSNPRLTHRSSPGYVEENSTQIASNWVRPVTFTVIV